MTQTGPAIIKLDRSLSYFFISISKLSYCLLYNYVIVVALCILEPCVSVSRTSFLAIVCCAPLTTLLSIYSQAKVRARLSRPLQRGHGKHVGRGDFRSGRSSGRVSKPSWSRPLPRSFPPRGIRSIGSRVPPGRPVSVRDRRPVMSMPVRARPVAPPARSYERRPAGMDSL